jgi:hypothetical protein
MFETEFRACGPAAEGELALSVRGLMRRRREGWHVRRSAIDWMSANLRYIPLRAALGLREKRSWKRLRRLIAAVEIT